MLAKFLQLGSVTPQTIEDVFSAYVYAGNGASQTIVNGINLEYRGTTDQQAYTTPGTYTWVCPQGVTSVSVVCVGGGGGGGASYDTGTVYEMGGGGGGGALAYANNISVTPGSSYTVVVGAGGVAGTAGGNGGNGGNSSFNSTSVIAGGGSGGSGEPNHGAGGAGGTVGAGSGGAGGDGGSGNVLNNSYSGGGGGAGGYSGTGGAGGSAVVSGPNPGAAAAASSGGAGGGSTATSDDIGYRIGAGSGGGVGILGSGATGGATSVPSGGSGATTYGGKAGSGGTDGTDAVADGENYIVGGIPGTYGGGGGGMCISPSARAGAGGAVRIIWPGNTRSFPSTNTEDVTPTGGGTSNGGLVWIRNRMGGGNAYHALVDTERGFDKWLATNATDGQTTQVLFDSFNTNGFTLATPPSSGNVSDGTNDSSQYYISWSFKKAAKFFDIVTYTGNGSARTIAHSLGQAPGMIIVKCTSTTGNWAVYHRSTDETDYLLMNSTAATADLNTYWNDNAPTSSVFSVGTHADVNTNGATYVAYLFAHDTSPAGLVQCGSFTTDGSGNASVTLGWEPQYVLVKASSATGDWIIVETARGWNTKATDSRLLANSITGEIAGEYGEPNATGFSQVLSASTTYVYVAIRRGPMRLPTNGTQVFQPVAYTANNSDRRLIDAGIVTDMVLARRRSSTSSYGFVVGDRLRGNYFLASRTTGAEAFDLDTLMSHISTIGNSFGNMTGFGVGRDATATLNYGTSTQLAYAFRRYPGVFDAVCYTGTGSAMNVAHNLCVVPELIIVKRRDSSTGGNWFVYCSQLATPNDSYLTLESTGSVATFTAMWNAGHASTTFGVGASDTNINTAKHVAYLFSTKAGISKVGSYTGNDTNQTINCGFAAGARFILIKRTDNTGDWYVWDSVRGIIAGNDPHLSLTTTSAEVTTNDSIDPDTSGFIVNQLAATNINVSSATYIYLAFA